MWLHMIAHNCQKVEQCAFCNMLQHSYIVQPISTFFTEVNLTFYNWRFYTWRWREQERFWACSLEELSALATFANQHPSMSLQAAYLVLNWDIVRHLLMIKWCPDISSVFQCYPVFVFSINSFVLFFELFLQSFTYSCHFLFFFISSIFSMMNMLSDGFGCLGRSRFRLWHQDDVCGRWPCWLLVQFHTKPGN